MAQNPYLAPEWTLERLEAKQAEIQAQRHAILDEGRLVAQAIDAHQAKLRIAATLQSLTPAQREALGIRDQTLSGVGGIAADASAGVPGGKE